MKCDNIYIRLIKKALSSKCKHRVSAIGLDYRGRIIDCTCNRHRFPRLGGGMHAERLLILRNPKSLKTIMICRVGRQGNLLPIQPCASCLTLARKRGVKIISVYH